MKNFQNIWYDICSLIKTKISEDDYNKWISSLELVDFSENLVVIGVPNNFFASLLSDHFGSIIEFAVSNALNKKNINIEYKTVINENLKYQKVDTKSRVTNILNDKNKKNKFINKKFCFENFAVGDENNFAYSVVFKVIESKINSCDYNPILIYGKTGVGKTHLLQAIVNSISEKNKNLIIEYMTCEEFVNLYIDAIRNKNIIKFRKYIRNVDMLLIDDIHFLAAKKETQEEFLNMFNSLYNKGKQIILSSDRLPNEICNLNDKLSSRFEIGITVNIDNPGFDLRFKILKMKQLNNSIKFSDEILHFIASNIFSIRKLEGAIIKLIMHTNFKKRTLTNEEIEDILLPTIIQEPYFVISIDRIQELVSKFYNISVLNMKNKSKLKKFSRPRMIAMYLSKILTDRTLSYIGDKFGNKSSTNVFNSVKSIKKLMINDQNLESVIKRFCLELKNYK